MLKKLGEMSEARFWTMWIFLLVGITLVMYVLMINGFLLPATSPWEMNPLKIGLAVAATFVALLLPIAYLTQRYVVGVQTKPDGNGA